MPLILSRMAAQYAGTEQVLKTKRYFLIDQQIARHFVHYSECLYHPLIYYATQIINPFLTLRILANHDKGLGF